MSRASPAPLAWGLCPSPQHRGVPLALPAAALLLAAPGCHRSFLTPLPTPGGGHAASRRLRLLAGSSRSFWKEFRWSPLPVLLGGSPVTSQIPPCSQPQSQALQCWDTSTRLSGQQNQPPKAQALRYIFTSMTSCYIFHTVPASLSKRVVFLYFPYPPPAHSLGALHAHVLLSCVEHRLVSSQMLSGKAQRSRRLLGYLLSQPLSSQADIIAFVL